MKKLIIPFCLYALCLVSCSDQNTIQGVSKGFNDKNQLVVESGIHTYEFDITDTEWIGPAVMKDDKLSITYESHFFGTDKALSITVQTKPRYMDPKPDKSKELLVR